MRRSLAGLVVLASLFFGATPARALPATYGTIYGTVTDDSTGAPIEGICVETDDGPTPASATTDSDGHYAVDLPPGDYSLEFWDCNDDARYASEWFDDKQDYYEADPVTVTNGAVTTADAGLAPTGTISGTVTDENGDPLSICVSATGDDVGNSTWSEGDGTYRLTGLLPGTYTVQFGCDGPYYSVVVVETASGSPPYPYPYHPYPRPGYVPQWFDHATRADDATPITVAGGQHVSGVDAVVAIAGAINGYVKNQYGDPVEGVCVSATQDGGDGSGETLTGSGGYYTIYNLAPGDYTVHFDDCSRSLYADQWYPGAAAADDAIDVSVTKGMFTPGIDAELIALPHPDVAISNVSVENVPLTTDAATLPSAGLKRVIHVDIANEGAKPASNAFFAVWVTTKSDGQSTFLDQDTISLVSGEATTRAIDWNATGSVGDVKITAVVCTPFDPNTANDRRSVDHYAVVGGTGAGFSVLAQGYPAGSPLPPDYYCSPDVY